MEVSVGQCHPRSFQFFCSLSSSLCFTFSHYSHHHQNCFALESDGILCRHLQENKISCLQPIYFLKEKRNCCTAVKIISTPSHTHIHLTRKVIMDMFGYIGLLQFLAPLAFFCGMMNFNDQSISVGIVLQQAHYSLNMAAPLQDKQLYELHRGQSNQYATYLFNQLRCLQKRVGDYIVIGRIVLVMRAADRNNICKIVRIN